jgi:hypothetical protein
MRILTEFLDNSTSLHWRSEYLSKTPCFPQRSSPSRKQPQKATRAAVHALSLVMRFPPPPNRRFLRCRKMSIVMGLQFCFSPPFSLLWEFLSPLLTEANKPPLWPPPTPIRDRQWVIAERYMLIVAALSLVFSLHQHVNIISVSTSIQFSFDFVSAQNFFQILKAHLYLFQVLLASELPMRFKHSILKFLLCFANCLVLSCFSRNFLISGGMLSLLNFSTFLLWTGLLLPFVLLRFSPCWVEAVGSVLLVSCGGDMESLWHWM